MVASTARELLNKSENERSGVLSTAMSFLGLYRDPVVAQVTRQCDWRIADLVEALHADGWLLGVATGKSDRGLEHCLASHGLSRHFVTLQTADRHPSKPHPAMLEAALFEAGAMPQHAVMIGDTAYDMVMAVNAGVRALGVDWGYHTPAELVDAGAEIVARTPLHLLDLL